MPDPSHFSLRVQDYPALISAAAASLTLFTFSSGSSPCSQLGSFRAETRDDVIVTPLLFLAPDQ